MSLLICFQKFIVPPFSRAKWVFLAMTLRCNSIALFCLIREKEQMLTLEGVELQCIRDDLKKKIEQIQFDFFEALVPIVGRLQVSLLHNIDILISTYRH